MYYLFLFSLSALSDRRRLRKVLKNKIRISFMVSVYSHFKVRPSWVFILPPLLICVGILIGFGFSFLFLTFTILILSSFYFTFSFNFRERISVSAAYSEETESKSRRSSSEFQYVDRFSIREDSDNFDRPSPDPVMPGLCHSDGSISDEENLIEIALQTGYFVDHENEEDERSRFQKKPDFSPESNLKNGLMEFSADRINDVNEEDNLIEIDISEGSIKHTSYEIVD